MVNFQILTDALCDLPADWVAKRDCLTVVETPIIVTGRHHNLTLHDLAADDFSQVEYYIDQGDSVTTSQPHILDPDGTNPNSIESLTRKYVLGGKDVIYIVMNSELSGAYDTASALFSQLENWATEQGRHITCVDSKCMSTGLALLLMELDEKIQSGKITNIAEIRDFVEKERGHIGHYFTWGGRTVAHVLAQFFLWKGKTLFNIANALVSVLLVFELYWCINYSSIIIL